MHNCRFSNAEKDAMREAAHQYAVAHDLPTEDLSWLHGHFGAHAVQCLAVWAACLTQCALLQGAWTKEDSDRLKHLVEELGTR